MIGVKKNIKIKLRLLNFYYLLLYKSAQKDLNLDKITWISKKARLEKACI